MARKLRFIGWQDVLPKRERRTDVLDEHDILRAVILAESKEGDVWVVFECEDRMHAIKAAHYINGFGFNVEAVARVDRLYIRRAVL